MPTDRWNISSHVGALLQGSQFNSPLVVVAVSVMMGGCIAPYDASKPYPLGRPYGNRTIGPPLLPASDTIDLENSDRVARFRRLAGLNGIAPPIIEQIFAPSVQVSGVDRRIPVLRITFDEKILFDFDRDQPRTEAVQVIDLIADSMRRDVPDAQLTLLGHTDAVGSDAYNVDLSLRRARSVFQALVDRGVNSGELSTVAVGKNQPIAPNSTAEGRARNRRVELLISASLDANLAVVKLRPLNLGYLSLGSDPAHISPESLSLSVLRPLTYEGPSDVSEAKPHGKIELHPMGKLTLQSTTPEPPPASAIPAPAPVPNIPAPQPEIRLNVPTEPHAAPLGPAQTY